MASIELITTKWVEKYGESILIDLERIKTNPFWTFQTLATKYRSTRQNMEQKFLRLHGSYTPHLKDKRAAFQREYNQPLDPDSKLLISKGATTNGVVRHFMAESKFLQACKVFDIPYEIKPANSILRTNIVVRGMHISITSVRKPRKYRPDSLTLYHQVSFIRKTIEVSDLLVAVLPNDEFIFAHREDFGKGTSIYIPSKVRSVRQKEKRDKHLNRWDLLF